MMSLLNWRACTQPTHFITMTSKPIVTSLRHNYTIRWLITTLRGSNTIIHLMRLNTHMRCHTSLRTCN